MKTGLSIPAGKVPIVDKILYSWEQVRLRSIDSLRFLYRLNQVSRVYHRDCTVIDLHGGAVLEGLMRADKVIKLDVLK